MDYTLGIEEKALKMGHFRLFSGFLGVKVGNNGPNQLNLGANGQYLGLNGWL